jgi:hypothetical protein
MIGMTTPRSSASAQAISVSTAGDREQPRVESALLALVAASFGGKPCLLLGMPTSPFGERINGRRLRHSALANQGIDSRTRRRALARSNHVQHRCFYTAYVISWRRRFRQRTRIRPNSITMPCSARFAGQGSDAGCIRVKHLANCT